jgi:hypothetical protein
MWGNQPIIENSELIQCYAAIEHLASCGNDEVENRVTTEIFENIDEESISNDEFKRNLGPNSLAIFLRWGRGLGYDGNGNPIPGFRG